MPICGEKLLLWNQGADDLETWYTASGGVLPIISYDDRDHFYDRIKFVSKCFCIGERLYSIEC